MSDDIRNPLKVHIERDYSYIEFEIQSGEEIPPREYLLSLWDRLPGKDTQPIGANGLRETPDSAARNRAKGVKRIDPPATPNQRRVLVQYGKWYDGMTKNEASRILTEMGR